MSAGSARGAEWQALRLACLERDGWQCTYCGKAPLIGDDATADHAIPKALGGPDALWNLRASCRKCNAQKREHVAARVNWFDSEWLDSLV